MNDENNIWSEVRRLQEIRLRAAVSTEAFSVDDVMFLLARIDQRDRAFKELLRQRQATNEQYPTGETR